MLAEPVVDKIKIKFPFIDILQGLRVVVYPVYLEFASLNSPDILTYNKEVILIIVNDRNPDVVYIQHLLMALW